MPTKTLIITERFWPEGSGGELATNMIAKLLSKEDNLSLEVLSGTKDPQKSGSFNYKFVPLLNTSKKIDLWLNTYFLSKKSWFIEKLEEADIVYIPSFCFPLVPLAKKLSNKVIVHLHDYQAIRYSSVFFHNSGNNRFEFFNSTLKVEMKENENLVNSFLGVLISPLNRLSRKWLSKADKLICVSEKQKEILSKGAPELKNIMTVINNPAPPIPQPGFNKKNNNSILYLGGDSYVKGFQKFLKVSEKLLERRPQVKFIVTGNLKSKNKNYLRKLNKKFRGGYIVPGFLKRKTLIEIYSKSNGLFFPSIWEEPLPFVIMESMLSGTIPVASRVGGVPEMIKGTYGEKVLFDPDNIDQQVHYLDKVLNLSSDKTSKIGKNLRRKAEDRYSKNKIANKLMEVFT